MRKRLAFLVFIACLMCNLLACGNSVDKNETAKNNASDSEAKATNDKAETSDVEPESNDSSTDDSEEPDDTMTEYQKLFQYGPLLVRDENYNWGYLNESGEYAIEPIFSEANPFGGNGLATVQDADSELWGIIDSSGNYVIEPMYSGLGTGFRNGLLLAREPGLDAGYIDESGEYVIEPQFKKACEFWNGFARVSSHSVTLSDSSYYWLMGYIDTSGKRITEDIFPDAKDFNEDRARVQIGAYMSGTYGYIDTTGNLVIEPVYTTADEYFKDGVVSVSIEDGAGQITNSLIDKDGNVIFSGNGLRKFESGLCPVPTTHNEFDYTKPDYIDAEKNAIKIHRENTDYVYQNAEGETILPVEGMPYEDATDFQEGYAAVMDAESHLWGYIDTKGNWVASPQYVLAFPYQKGLAVVATELNEIQTGIAYSYSGYQVIDSSGKCVTKFNDNTVPVIQGSTNPILSTERIVVGTVDENGILKMGLCDYDNNLVVDCIFDQIESIADDSSYAKVCYNGLYGMIDMDGNWLIQANFTSIE